MEQIDYTRAGGWTVGALAKALRDELTPHYGSGEARAMVGLIFHTLKGWDTTAMIINSDVEVSPYILSKISNIMERLGKDEPIQYILGEARFYGMDMTVDGNVLIPRPETEELVDMIVRENPGSDLRVADIGTGSGAIAIALSRNLPFSRVTAIDISAGALDVARKNALRLHAKIDFIRQDVFLWNPVPESFDIIVSNPPYIAEKERADMDPNVLRYEPSGALFVPDSHPLIYYSRIATVAAGALCGGGKLYFEINPLYSSELKSILETEGFVNVEIVRDIPGRDRFARCEKPE